MSRRRLDPRGGLQRRLVVAPVAPFEAVQRPACRACPPDGPRDPTGGAAHRPRRPSRAGRRRARARRRRSARPVHRGCARARRRVRRRAPLRDPRRARRAARRGRRRGPCGTAAGRRARCGRASARRSRAGRAGRAARPRRAPLRASPRGVRRRDRPPSRARRPSRAGARPRAGRGPRARDGDARGSSSRACGRAPGCAASASARVPRASCESPWAFVLLRAQGVSCESAGVRLRVGHLRELNSL